MRRLSILLLVFFTCSVLTAWPQAQAQWQDKMLTFDVPGGGTAAGQGTTLIGFDSHSRRAPLLIGGYVEICNNFADCQLQMFFRNGWHKHFWAHTVHSYSYSSNPFFLFNLVDGLWE